jgi:O-antigen/teichoic acid export membrane protein
MLRSPVFRQFLLYSSGALFLRGVSFLLIPVYTRLLDPAEYGRLDLVLTVSYTLELFFSWGLLQVMQMDYYKFSDEERNVRLSQILTLYTFLSGGLYAVTFFVLPSAAESFEVSRMLLVPALANSFLNFYQGFLLIRLRFSERPKVFTGMQVGLGLLSLILNLLFVVGLRSGISGIIYSNLITVAVAAVALFGFHRDGAGVRPGVLTRSAVSGLLRHGVLFLPGLLSYWLMSAAGRWFLLHHSGIDQVGLYSVATRFSFIVEPLVLQPLLNAWTPRMLKGFAAGDYRVRISRWLLPVMVAAVAGGFLLQLVAGWVVDDSYREGLYVIPVLVLGTGFSLLAQAAAQLVIFRRKVHLTMSGIVTGLCVTMASNYLLVPRFGVYGAAISTVAGNLCWFLIVYGFFLRERSRAEAGQD